VHFGASTLLGFEFLLFLEFAFGFFDAEAGVHFEEGDRSQPLIAAKRKILTQHAKAR
jgi:hypothetical protein